MKFSMEFVENVILRLMEDTKKRDKKNDSKQMPGRRDPYNNLL